MILSSIYLILVTLMLVGCVTAQTDPELSIADSSTSKDAAISQSSYQLALLHVKTLREGKYNLDQSAYERGLQDALNGKSADLQTSVASSWKTLATVCYEELKAANLAAGKAFLEHNKTRNGVKTLPSGVQYEVLKQGNGKLQPTLDDTVGILYKIASIEGTVKINTMGKEGRKMYEIPLQKIISQGWRETIKLMTEGSQWRLYIPGELAFGEKGLSEKGILPNETLVIETHLDSIVALPK